MGKDDPCGYLGTAGVTIPEAHTWWLQYKPARAQAPMAKAALNSATMAEVCGVAPATCAAPAGVSTEQASMHSAGPPKATPCGTRRATP